MAEVAMGVPMSAFVQAIETVLRTGSRQAIKYLSNKLVVKATRKSFKGRPARDRGQETLLVTFGRPNYREREFIQVANKAGEPFPIKHCQLRGFPGKKK
jgi:hypothetical protein